MTDATSTSDRWDTVHTVNDYWDGPRGGVADLNGIPHVYKCEWNSTADDWDEVFQLTPISPKDLALVMESWAIWRRWKAASDAGSLTADDLHPALAQDRVRREQLDPVVETILHPLQSPIARAIPEFSGTMEPHALRVRWKII